MALALESTKILEFLELVGRLKVIMTMSLNFSLIAIYLNLILNKINSLPAFLAS